MSFALLIVGNLLRQKIRTGLTVIGISIGITAVVAFGIITRSAMSATAALLTAGGADFSVGRQGSSDLTFSILTDQDVADVEAYDEVEHVVPTLLAFSRVGSNSFFAQVGIRPDDLEWFEVPMREGRQLEAGGEREIMLGSRAASDLGADIGDTVVLREATGETFTVVGIFDSNITYLNGGAIVALEELQAIENKVDLYTLLFVYAKPGVDTEALQAQIRADNPGLATLEDIGDVGDVDQGLEIMDAINLAITGLAVFIGGIAVMNTMAMAVFERTREFGILRAVGWRTRRIIQMVLGESLVLCLIASVVGSILAILLTRLLILVPTIRAFIELEYPPDVFLRGVAVGIGVALLGALYPAFRAASYSPAQAIRYE
jgi:putative ABC transport system permease protein